MGGVKRGESRNGPCGMVMQAGLDCDKNEGIKLNPKKEDYREKKRGGWHAWHVGLGCPSILCMCVWCVCV